MAKLNIDGVDVYTDDFDEDQTKIFQEVQQIGSELARLEFLTHCLKQRQNALAPLLLPKEEKKEETKKDSKK